MDAKIIALKSKKNPIVIGVLGVTLLLYGIAVMMRPMLLGLLLVPFFFLTLGLIFFKNWDLGFKRALLIVAVGNIIFPWIKITKSIPMIRFEEVFGSVIMFILFAAVAVKPGAISQKKFPSYKWFLIWAIFVFTSITYGSIFMGMYPTVNDFFEFVRIAKYFAIYYVFSQLIEDEEMLKKLQYSILAALTISAIIGCLQFLHIGPVNSSITPLYMQEGQIEKLSIFVRATGTTANPNVFGFLMVLATSLAFSHFLRSKRRVLFMSLTILFAVALVFSLSRTSLLAFIVAQAVCYVQYIRETKRMSTLFRLAFLTAIFVGAAAYFTPDVYVNRVKDGAKIWKNTSFQNRVVKWKDCWHDTKKSPVFGWGPAKQSMERIVDSEWLLLLRRYGFAGTAVFICLFLSMAAYPGRAFHKFSLSEKALSATLTGTTAGLALYMTTANLYHELQVMPVLILMYGAMAGRAHKLQDSDHVV